jgi:parallel beta-helix repeat protein
MKGNKKNKKVLIGSVSIASTTVLIVAAIAPSLFISIDDNLTPSTLEDFWDIIVPDDYNTIHEAVENAEPEFKIFVRSGRYYPSSGFLSTSLKIKKMGITLQGQNENDTEISGRGATSVIYIDANNVVISGFTLSNNAVNGSLITVDSKNCTIKNNILEVRDYVEGTEYGIKLYSNENKILDNKVINADDAIQIVGSDNNLIANNTLEDNYNGIVLGNILKLNLSERFTERLYEKGSYQNKIINNTFLKNSRAIVVDSSSENQILNNTIISNNRFGLILSWCSNNIIKNNELFGCGIEIWGNDLSNYVHEITGNKVNNKPLYYYYKQSRVDVPSDAGQIIIVDCDYITIKNVKISNTSTAILIAYSYNTRIQNCEFSDNYRAIYLYYSKKCTTTKNNFIKNTYDARFIAFGYYDSKTYTWSKNYWDSWLGTKSFIFRLTRKRIHGRYHLKRGFRIMEKLQFGIRTRNFDRNPSTKPYNI